MEPYRKRRRVSQKRSEDRRSGLLSGGIESGGRLLEVFEIVLTERDDLIGALLAGRCGQFGRFGLGPKRSDTRGGMEVS